MLVRDRRPAPNCLEAPCSRGHEQKAKVSTGGVEGCRMCLTMLAGKKGQMAQRLEAARASRVGNQISCKEILGKPIKDEGRLGLQGSPQGRD